MLETLPVCLIVGTALGFLSGLGIGGGSLLLVWLTSVLEWDILTARAANLLFFLPAALIASFIRFQRGQLMLKPVIPAIVTGCIMAAAGSFASGLIHTATLKRMFGILLILAGVKELLYRERKAR